MGKIVMNIINDIGAAGGGNILSIFSFFFNRSYRSMKGRLSSVLDGHYRVPRAQVSSQCGYTSLKSRFHSNLPIFSI